MPTEDKIALVDALSATGLAKIEGTPFVSPKAIAALRDSEQVMNEITRVQGVVYSALVHHIRGRSGRSTRAPTNSTSSCRPARAITCPPCG